MNKSVFSTVMLAAMTTIAVPSISFAQNQPQTNPARDGETAPGTPGQRVQPPPVNGTITGSIAGDLTMDDRIYVREYVVRREVPSARYEGDLVVGTEIPGTVTYYRIEDNPRLSSYRYTRVNNRYVLVDSSNRFITYVE